MTISAALLFRDFKSVFIDRYVNAGVGGDYLLLGGLSLNHALIEIDM